MRISSSRGLLSGVRIERSLYDEKHIQQNLCSPHEEASCYVDHHHGYSDFNHILERHFPTSWLDLLSLGCWIRDPRRRNKKRNALRRFI